MFANRLSLEDNRTCWNISSISESKLSKLYSKHQCILIDFHKKFFTRIYPNAIRLNSSNYSPIEGFLSGSQIVALNF